MRDYRSAFLWLGVPALLTVLSVLAVRLRFSFAGHITSPPAGAVPSRLPDAFWIYASASALIAFGFADYPLIAFHFAKDRVLSQSLIPVFYALAMGAAGAGSLLFGRWCMTDGACVVLVPAFVLGALRRRWYFSAASGRPFSAGSPGSGASARGCMMR